MSASIRNKKLIKLGMAVAGVVVILVTGVIIKSSLDANALETAIGKGDWQTLLELDPDNQEGLRLKAALVNDALEEGNWQVILELEPGNIEGLRLKKTAEKAAAIEDALSKGDWKTILDADPTDSIGLLLKAADDVPSLAIEELDHYPADYPRRHPVDSVQISSDGKAVLSKNHDSIVLWDAQNGTEVIRLPAALYGEVAFSTDGKFIAAARKSISTDLKEVEGGVELWDVQRKEKFRELSYVVPVAALTYSPNGELIATGWRGLQNAGITIHHSQSGDKIKSFSGGEQISMLKFAFSSDGSSFVFCFNEDVWVWTVQGGEARKLISNSVGNETIYFLSVGFNEDGNIITVDSSPGGGKTQLWDVKSGLPIESPKLLAVERNRNASRLFVSNGASQSEKFLTEIVLNHPTKRKFSLIDASGNSLWQLDTEQIKGRTTDTAFSPDGTLIAMGTDFRDPHSIHLLHAESGRELLTLTSHKSYVRCLAFTSDGKTLASGHNQGNVLLWDVSALTEHLSKQ